MANMINNGSNISDNSTISSLRDVCNFLQAPINATMMLSAGACPYDHIIEMIRGLDLQDDGIVMNHKIKSIETDFCNIVRDENMLCESMEYINDKALADGETALKFALLFSSRNFDALAMKETKVRSAMLKILETNFLNADTYRMQDKDRLYNSITLLGEYYHRVRLADNSPITILGESLLGLLIREVSALEMIDVKLAKLILAQITLNGDVMRVKHKAELTQLLYHIRRNLIEQPVLTSAVKALLLMTIDLYYSNFANLGVQLEEMYTKYLVQEHEDEGNNNQQLPAATQQTYQTQQQQYHSTTQQQHEQNCTLTEQQIAHTNSNNNSSSSYENGITENTVVNDAYEVQQPTAKKWSEQVCEDSFCEAEFGNYDPELEVVGNESAEPQERLNNSYIDQREQLHSSSTHYDNDREHTSHNSQRSNSQQKRSPRKQNHFANETQQQQQSQQSGGEERDQSKPLPRWRAPRFNRDTTAAAAQHDGRYRNQQRRFSASFDDDHQSVHSEGGSIRLYSINDRLKHSQEKIERSSGNSYASSIANWDHQSQRDDRSERSYMSNYERGNNRHGGRHYNNNRYTYDKPPRFQKNHHQSQQQQRQQQQNNNYNNNNNNNSNNKDNNNKNRGDAWRQDGGDATCHTNGPESNSRSSSRARTLPRPAKSNMDGSGGNAYRHSQSPTQQQQQQQQYQQRQRQRTHHNYNGRYSSQSSLASEASSTLDRRHNQRNRNFSQRHEKTQQQDWEDTHSVHGQPEEQSWDTKDNNSELVRNARQTTKYMNYLSAKK